MVPRGRLPRLASHVAMLPPAGRRAPIESDGGGAQPDDRRDRLARRQDMRNWTVAAIASARGRTRRSAGPRARSTRTLAVTPRRSHRARCGSGGGDRAGPGAARGRVGALRVSGRNPADLVAELDGGRNRAGAVPSRPPRASRLTARTASSPRMATSARHSSTSGRARRWTRPGRTTPTRAPMVIVGSSTQHRSLILSSATGPVAGS